MDKRIEMVDCEYNDLTTATNFAGHPRHSIIFQSASHTNESNAFEKSMKVTINPSFDLHFLSISLHKPNTTSRVDLFGRNPPCCCLITRSTQLLMRFRITVVKIFSIDEIRDIPLYIFGSKREPFPLYRQTKVASTQSSGIWSSSDSSLIRTHITLISFHNTLSEDSDFLHTSDGISGRFTALSGFPIAAAFFISSHVGGPVSTSHSFSYLDLSPNHSSAIFQAFLDLHSSSTLDSLTPTKS